MTMNQQRRDAYSDLIQALLNCAKGQEAAILKAHPDLIDQGLFESLEEAANRRAEKGMQDAADYLRHLAKLADSIRNSVFEVPRRLLHQLLPENLDSSLEPEIMQALLEKHLDELNDSFLVVWQEWTTVNLSSIEKKYKPELAKRVKIFSDCIRQLSRGDRAINIEVALTGYEMIAKLIEPNDYSVEWANNQNSLGLTYLERIRGDWEENIENAIKAFTASLAVYTQERPWEWSEVQISLGQTYLERIQGEKVENIEAAIYCFKAALNVIRLKETLAVKPQEELQAQREMVENHLGQAYSELMELKVENSSLRARLKRGVNKLLNRDSQE